MYGVLGEAPVLAVLVAIMVMIQREMVAHSWTVITKNTMEHSRAAHADGQGWSAIGSSGQPLRAAGLGPSWARSSTKLKALLGPNGTWASRADSCTNGSGADVAGYWLTPQGRAGQTYGVSGPRPSWARPSAMPESLLDETEQRHSQVGSDAKGVGADGSGAVGSDAAGSDAVSRKGGSSDSSRPNDGIFGSGGGSIGDDCNTNGDCGYGMVCTELATCGQLKCDGDGECFMTVGFAFVVIGPTVGHASTHTAACETYSTAEPTGNSGWAAMGAMALGLADRRRRNRNRRGGSQGARSNSTDGLEPMGSTLALPSAVGSEVDSDIQVILAPGTASGYRGVSYDSDRGIYRAVAIAKGRKRLRLGDFSTAIEAAHCYARYVQARDERVLQQTAAVDDKHVVWQLHLAPGTQTGYKGVEQRPHITKSQRPFRARHDKHNIGYFTTAIEAAVAYAKHVSSKRVAETEIMLSDLERLAEKDVDARNTSGVCTVGINVSGSHMGFDTSSGMADIGAHSIAADGMVSTSLSWVVDELMRPDPNTVGGGERVCNLLGCSEQDHSDQGCGGQGSSNLGYNEQDLGCGGPGCGNLSHGDLNCDDLSCGGLTCSDLGCGDLGCDGPGSDDLELLLGL